MKCISCETEINPKWKHAIDRNICPFCGQSIMEELLKSLISVLQDTMEKLQAYPRQLNDWLLSNYSYIKTDDPDLKNYVPKEAIREIKKELDSEDFDRKKKVIKVKTDQGEVEVVTEKIQSDTKTAGFFERAELIKPGASDGDEEGGDVDSSDHSQDDVELQTIKTSKPKAFKTAAERTQYLKKLKEKIETEGSQGIISEKGLVAMINPDQIDSADSQDVATLQAAISDGNIITSGLSITHNLDDEDTTTNRILSMNLAAVSRAGDAKGHNGGYNAKDAQALQNQVNKANSNNMGGGFSRRG